MRDFDAACGPTTHLTWLLYRWQATTPGNSTIAFAAQTADTQAALAGAPSVALATAVNQNGGTAFVSLAGLPGGVSKPWLRVTAALTPTSDGLQAPVLTAWDAQYDCTPAL